ncbi:MAG: DUF547 domain-containing protein [Magnetovibrionaceae bacterium]
MFSRLPGFLAVLVVSFMTFQQATQAAPKAELWDRWLAHEAGSTISVDHSEWDRLLKTYVFDRGDGVNRVAYDHINADDAARLEAYLKRLSETPVSRLDRPAQLAFWFNLYNALTVKVILDHYPVDSIRDIDISPGLFADGPWGKKLIAVEGVEVSLDDVEHRILRPIWRDPRIHYGVNCASYGCPNLLRQAFTAQNVDTLLTKGAKAYINSPRGARFDGEKLVVSKIYDWFEEDFGSSEEGVIAHLLLFANPDLKRRLADVAGIYDYEYDWSLNSLP